MYCFFVVFFEIIDSLKMQGQCVEVWSVVLLFLFGKSKPNLNVIMPLDVAFNLKWKTVDVIFSY